MDRKYCSHEARGVSVLFISWCRRCSGWRVTRAYSEPDSSSVDASNRVCESHFLPQEETDPGDFAAIVVRAAFAAQELAEDLADNDRLEFEWGHGA